MTNLAIFDLDYTLTKRGTWGRFVFQNVKKQPWRWLPLIITTLRHQWLYKKGKIPRIGVKKAMMCKSMTGKGQQEIEALAEKFAEKEVPSKLRPGAIRALKAHRDKGDTIIIASAGACVVVEAIARRLNITHWVATDMKWENDCVADKFASKNCYGQEKLARVLQLFEDNKTLKHSDTHITFYSDSHSDIEMFTFCDIGVAVNPSSKLRATADELGIEIVDWNK